MFPGTSFQLVSLPPSSLSLPLSFPLFHAPLFFTDSSSRSGSAFRNPIPRDGKKLNVRVSRTVVLSNLSTVHSRYPRIVVTFFLAVVGRETKKRANWQDLDENGARGREEKRREEKREQATGTLPAHGTRFCLSGRRAGRLITVAFCGFVARHDHVRSADPIVPRLIVPGTVPNDRSSWESWLTRVCAGVHSLAASIVDTTSVIFSSFLFVSSFTIHCREKLSRALNPISGNNVPGHRVRICRGTRHIRIMNKRANAVIGAKEHRLNGASRPVQVGSR